MVYFRVKLEGKYVLREIDAYVREALEKPPMSQVFAVLLPMHRKSVDKKYSVAIRTFITKDYMTGRPAVIGKDITKKTIKSLVVIAFNLTHIIR